MRENGQHGAKTAVLLYDETIHPRSGKALRLVYIMMLTVSRAMRPYEAKWEVDAESLEVCLSDFSTKLLTYGELTRYSRRPTNKHGLFRCDVHKPTIYFPHENMRMKI